MAQYGIGAGGLAGAGFEQQNQALGILGSAAEDETRRNIANKQANQARKAGNAQLGATLGAAGGMALGMQMGAVGGPMGAMVGGLIGGIAGGLF